MTFEKGVDDFNKYLSFVFIIFCKNLVQTYWYQSLEVSSWEPLNIALFLSLFALIDWGLFWYFFQDYFKNQKELIIMAGFTLIFVCIPYFLYNPVFKYDHDNLFIKSVFFFILFAVFVFIKKSPQQIFLPIVMAFIPLVNLEIGNGFIGNPSYLDFVFRNTDLVMTVNPTVYIDFAQVLIRTFFWAAIVILFYEINHQFFAFKSWSLFVELPLSKSYLLLVFLIFKTLIYWFLASMIIAILGDQVLPLFSNKVGLALNMIGYIGMLSLFTLYFRKYLTLYFYDKCGHSNWLYPFFFIPVLDLVALLIVMVLPPLLVKRIFGTNYSVKLLVKVLMGVFMIYIAYSWLMVVRNVPDTQPLVKRSLYISRIIVPLIAVLGIYWSQKSSVVYKGLMIFLFLLVPFYMLFVINQELVAALKVEQIVHLVAVYLNIGLLVAFMYPVLNFKSFLKL